MVRLFCMYFAILIMMVSCGGGSGSTGEEGSAESKKVFRYNQAEGLSSLDPAFARNQANIWAVTQMFNSLFELDKEMHIHPSLVDSWDLSDDGLTYTFNLKTGVKFHDSDVFEGGEGREVVAEDFVYSFKRILDPATASTGAWIFNDKVKRGDDGNISDDWVTAPDTHTLVIQLATPFAAFLDILTMPYTFVVPKEAVDKHGKDFRVHPVGTGPFVFKSWEEGNSLIMLKNENYWAKDEEHNQLPYLDAVKVTFIADKNQELLSFQQGNLDFISGIQANSADNILNADGTPNAEFSNKYNVEVVPYMNTEYLGISQDAAAYGGDENHPLLNKDFRKALSYAINREELVSSLLNNLGEPGTSGMIPAAMHAFDAEHVIGYTYDAQKAQELLKSSGFGPGGKAIPEITLYTTSQYVSIMEYLQAQWSNIGVNIKVEVNQAATHQEMVDNARISFFRASWLGDYPDEENYMSLFYSKNFSPAGPNKTRFTNSGFDQLYEKSKTIPDTDGFDRIDIYREMDKIIVEEAPVIVLFYDEVLRMTQNNVTGLEPDPMNVLRLERANLSEGTAAEETAEAQ